MYIFIKLINKVGYLMSEVNAPITLSPDQQNAVSLAMNWWADPNKTVSPLVITGAAGTGKSSLVAHILQTLNISISNVLMVATSATATENIQRKNPRARARTIASFLKSQREVIVIMRDQSVIETWADAEDVLRSKIGGINAEAFSREVIKESAHESGDVDGVKLSLFVNALEPLGYYIERAQEFNITGAKLDEETRVIIVDELGMVSGVEMEAMRATEMPIIATGDPYQLPPIGEKPTHYITDPEGTYQYRGNLTEIHRQATNSQLLDVATVARQGGDWYQQAQYAQSIGSIDVFVRPDIANSPNVAEQLSFANVILAGTNKAVIRYNRLLHERNFPNQLLGVGDKIVISANTMAKNDIGLPMYVNGQSGTITKIWDDIPALISHGLIMVDLEIEGIVHDRVIVNVTDIGNPKVNAFVLKDQSDAGMTEYRFRRSETFGELAIESGANLDEVVYITYGYAMTVHRAQGKEWDYVAFDSFIPSMMKRNEREIVYTAVTRAKKGLLII